MAFQFKIEHIALQPRRPALAMSLLSSLGLTEWVNDRMTVHGKVWSVPNQTGAVDLDFNYQADCDRMRDDGITRRPIELEIMNCVKGPNWMDGRADDNGENLISHFGMQVTYRELEEVHSIMETHNVEVAQDVVTIAHSNLHVKDTRRYRKVIFDTRSILGVDLEFNVLIPIGE